MKFIRIGNDYHNADLIKSAMLSYKDGGTSNEISIFTIYFADGSTLVYSGNENTNKLLGIKSFNEWCKQIDPTAES
jgi:hypothetical protein